MSEFFRFIFLGWWKNIFSTEPKPVKGCSTLNCQVLALTVSTLFKSSFLSEKADKFSLNLKTVYTL